MTFTTAAAAAAALLLAAATPATAIVRSFNGMSANAIRSGFSPADFKMTTFGADNTLSLPIGQVSLGTVDNSPLLGAPDIQMSYVAVKLNAGATLPAHTHPRATEMDYVVYGVVKNSIVEEFGSARPSIDAILHAGEVGVIPEGLVHAQTCMGSEGCLFIAMLNSAGTSLQPPLRARWPNSNANGRQPHVLSPGRVPPTIPGVPDATAPAPAVPVVVRRPQPITVFQYSRGVWCRPRRRHRCIPSLLGVCVFSTARRHRPPSLADQDDRLCFGRRLSARPHTRHLLIRPWHLYGSAAPV